MVWHKGCFKCSKPECSMTLSMKSYKGFNKLPYCNAHIPQIRPTTTVNSLEACRLAELTKLQSQVKYHENFEKSKGKLTQIADDVEIQRLKNNSKIISNVSYHGELERKQQMERNQSPVQKVEQNKVAQNNLINNQLNGNHHLKGQNGNSYLESAQKQLNNLSLNNNHHHQLNNQQHQLNKQQQANVFNGQQSVYVQQKEPHNAQILHQLKLSRQEYQLQQQHQYNINQPIQYNNLPQQITYNHQFGNNHHFINQQQHPNIYLQQQQQIKQQQPNVYLQQQQQQKQPQQQNDWSTSGQQNLVFRAMYDYTAADVDEVSFVDGDLITGCIYIDEGWLYGHISRTGQTGMLPANYCRPANG